MRFIVTCFAVYFATASVLLGEVVAKSLSTLGEEKPIKIANEEIQFGTHKAGGKVGGQSRSAGFQARSRRSADGRREVSLVDRLTEFVIVDEWEAAFSLYSKEVQKNGTHIANSRTEIVKWIVSNKYDEIETKYFLFFITERFHQLDEQCIWLKALHETMKTKNKLFGTNGLQLETVTKRALEALFKVNYKLDYDRQECDLELLAKTVSNDLMESIHKSCVDWAKSIQSGDDGDVINAAWKGKESFNSILHQLIPIAIGLNYSENESNDNFAQRCEKTIDFITHLPMLSATKALIHLNRILDNIEPHFIPIWERMSLSYTVKDLEYYADFTSEEDAEVKNELAKLIDQLRLNIKRILWDSYVFIYKDERTPNKIQKFIASHEPEENKNSTSTHYEEFKMTEERNQWILEPTSHIDQFRIKNKKTGEYLFADNKRTIFGNSLKRSVFTFKFDNESDINNNTIGYRMVWVLAPVIGKDRSIRFTIMNLHFKEYLDGHSTSRLFNEVHTWKNYITPPKSARGWIISDSDQYRKIESKKSIISSNYTPLKIELKETISISSERTPLKNEKGIRLVCFFDSLASQKTGTHQFTTDNIDPSLCTHLIYSKAKIDQDTFTMSTGDEQIDIIDKGYENIVALKNKNPSLKVMIYLNVWDAVRANERFLSSNVTVNTFVKSTVDFIEKHSFDGIHFNFNVESTDAESAQVVTLLLTALYEIYKSRNYLLSANLNSIEERVEGYSISRFSDMLDFIGLRGYSIHGYGIYDADHHAPLFHRPQQTQIHPSLNADYEVSQMIEDGAAPQKIVLGIPFFGESYILRTNYSKPPTQSRYGERIFKLSYHEICETIRKENWKVIQDPFRLMGPYTVSPPSDRRTWIGYDDPAMAEVKANYILSKGLGGAYVMDVSMDDFLNTCGGGFNPMLTVIANTLGIKALNSTSVKRDK